jgi:two-component system, NarL family, invasion response regulator UvrY
MIQVFIVDDHVIFREGLKKVLGTVPDISVAGEASNGSEALDKILGGVCDVVVLDLGLPGISGFDVLRTLKQKRPSLPIIVLSIHTEEEYSLMVLKAGGSGYLTKESVPEDLIRAIRKAVKKETYVSESLGERLVAKLRGHSQDKPHERLTAKEYQVFSLIVKGKSVKQISHQLSLARPTISTYRTRILQKMNMQSNAELGRYAAKHDLVD